MRECVCPLLAIVFSSIFSMQNCLATDYSKWSYDDLSRTACEMAGDKNYRGALKFFDLAVKTEPNNPQGYVNRGGMYELLHETEKAIKDEEKAIEMASSNSDRDKKFRSLAYRNLAGIYVHCGQLVKAESNARKSVNVGSEDPAASEFLGDILVKMGKPIEAQACYVIAKKMYEQKYLSKEAAIINSKLSKLQSN